MSRTDANWSAFFGALTGVVVDTTAEALGQANADFGRLAHGDARAVLRPRSTAELERVVRAANEHGVSLPARGQGLSQSGQALARGGCSLNLRALRSAAPAPPSSEKVRVSPGDTWREVLGRVAPHGLRPKVMPLNLDLSVGGTLSAGGFGSSSFRHGVAAANVSALDVVLGNGETVRANRSENSRVMSAVLGGLGRVGAIAAVELELQKIAEKTRTFYLLYDDVELLLRDLLVLSARPRVDHLEAFCSSTVQGLSLGPSGKREPFVLWQYGLHVSVEFGADSAAPGPEELLAGLSGRPRLLRVEDDDTPAFAARYDLRFEMMRKTGAWQQTHPWLECILPLNRAAELIPTVLGRLPLFLGDGHRIMLVSSERRPSAIAFPEGEQVLGFTVLPMGVPESLREPALGALRAIESLLLEAGGKRYLSGWLFDTTEARWREHYGSDYEQRLRDKADFDPNGVFDAQLGQPGLAR